LIRVRKAIGHRGSRQAPLPDEVRDYRLLLERWLRLVKGIPSLSLSLYSEADGYPLMVLQSENHDPEMPSVYFSAGIHGDEPAAVEGLVRWAESSIGALASWNWLIFPCLNPWGLERNTRTDAQGRDLNRFYNSRKVMQINDQRSLMRGRLFDAAAMLHEDYDSRGFYLYEVASQSGHWGETLCAELGSLMPADPRRRIDGHPARNGLIRRRITPELLKRHPEAFQLHFHHAARTFTLETPSEESLGERVLVQRFFLNALVKKLKLEMVSRPKLVRMKNS
jgi:murein peptide amidase A